MLQYILKVKSDKSYNHNTPQRSATILLCSKNISCDRSQGRLKVSGSKAQRRTRGSTTIRAVPPDFYPAIFGNSDSNCILAPGVDLQERPPALQNDGRVGCPSETYYPLSCNALLGDVVGTHLTSTNIGAKFLNILC